MTDVIKENNPERLELIIKGYPHADLEEKSKNGDSLLHIAVCCENLPCVKILLRKRFSLIDIKNLKGNTPLHIALHYDNPIADYLIKVGAN